MSKFTKYFKRSLISEADEAIANMDDATTFKQDFETPEAANQLDTEIANTTIPPEQRAIIIKKADKYSETITKVILPILRDLHNAIVSGEFKSIAPDIDGLSGINSDLAELAEQIRGKVRDSIVKQDKVDKK